MTTIIIEEDSLQVEKFLEFVRTLSFATVVEHKKQSFEEACAECNAVSVDVFIDELKKNVEQHYRDAKS